MQRSASGELIWKRASPIPTLPEGLTLSRRELFSICGQLVAHHPVAGWIRVACGYIKRASEGSAWDDDVGDKSRAMLQELLARLKQSDPVGGRWSVGDDSGAQKGTIWCDASSLAVGCLSALEMNGVIVEDGAWLRREDSGHINMAELDSVVRGLNLSAKWALEEVEIVTDSATVFSWLQSVLFDSHVVRTRGMSEMLVRRRLALVRDRRRPDFYGNNIFDT